MRKPNFFIVGAPKCGTTAMYQYLESHPEIYLSPVKEPYFFGSDLKYINLKRPTKDEYLALFEDATDEKIIGEASITYLVSTEAAQEIKSFNPEARVLIMLRNPVDMIYSMHSQALFVQVEDVEDLEKALSLEDFRKKGQRIPEKTTILSFILYRELASYSEQVERYFQVFGRDRVQVIIYDDFKQDTAGAYRKTLQFLGVNDEFRPERFDKVNVNKRRRNEWVTEILKNDWVIKAVRLLIPSRDLRQSVARKATFITIKETPRPAMPKELRVQLQADFLPEIERLSTLLNRDLTYWCKNSKANY